MKRPVTLFLDPISPYSYFACHLLSDVAKKHDLIVKCVPVLFAGLLNAHANKGPAEIPAKRRHLFLDCVRNAQLMKLPFQMPPGHPFNPLLALRTMTALGEVGNNNDDNNNNNNNSNSNNSNNSNNNNSNKSIDSQHHHNEKTFHFVKQVVNACWGQGMDITNPSTLLHIANQCDIDGNKLLLSANEDRIKTKLRYNTDHAVQIGVFGVPTLKIDEELFWGSDRMHHVEAYLEGKLAIDMKGFEKMINIPRSSDRKQT